MIDAQSPDAAAAPLRRSDPDTSMATGGSLQGLASVEEVPQPEGGDGNMLMWMVELSRPADEVKVRVAPPWRYGFDGLGSEQQVQKGPGSDIVRVVSDDL